MASYQDNQRNVIDAIEKQIQTNSLTVSTVSPVDDYQKDSRICLTSVHFPKEFLVQKIQETVIDPLRDIEPEHFYYPRDSLHMTIKNIRIINDPPHFTDGDIQKAKAIFSDVIPRHRKFNVYFYRLLLFPLNLALIGTTDPELDSIILDLDRKLIEAGVPDDKKYVNDKYFFGNITLARFKNPVSDTFQQKVGELSRTISFAPYAVDSVSLATGSAMFTKRNVYGTWELQE